MSLAGIEDFKPIIGVKNGKENKDGKETVCTRHTGNPADTEAKGQSTSPCFARTEAKGSMRHLQKNERGNIEVLTVR